MVIYIKRANIAVFSQKTIMHSVKLALLTFFYIFVRQFIKSTK